MSAARKEKPATLHTVPALENLASRLSVGGSGELVFFDRPPVVAGTIRNGDVAMWVATASSPFGWVLFWSKYMQSLVAREHLLVWADKQLQSRKVSPTHASYLKHLVANNFCHGQKLSASRIADTLNVGRNNTARKYIGILDSILYIASQGEDELGRQVRKITR